MGGIMRSLDVLFVHPGDSDKIYQSLSVKCSAIETPTWSLLLAESCRRKGYGVAILDCDAERLSYEEATKRIHDYKPRLVVFVVYGSNPNAGTTKMTGAVGLADFLRESYPEYKICFVGSHTSALPDEVLAMNSVDFVLLNEGVYALLNLLGTNLKDNLSVINGIGWKDGTQGKINEPSPVVPNERMDMDLPGYAWDLLPYKNKPLDLYRSCNWHTNFVEEKRSPYAAIYTSLGCRFRCSFCMINILNRTDNSEGITAAHSPIMRFWSPELMLNEVQKLLDLGVTTIRLSDEMFFLDKRYFAPFLEGIIERGYKDLCLWSYARVDTVRQKYLELFKNAGMNYLALGIEAADQKIRKEITKGSYEEVDIREVVKQIEDSGINVISNYIFGLPDDTHESMQQTLDLALELNTAMANMYPCFAFPGSPLYYTAKEQGWKLPETYDAWSFHSYKSLPLPTKHLTAAEVLRFRDNAWNLYFNNPAYLNRVEQLFGIGSRRQVEEMANIKLKREILQ
jgi:anaerobic magnesium-protoporphyrin IX monomethyl ester cyclase